MSRLFGGAAGAAWPTPVCPKARSSANEGDGWPNPHRRRKNHAPARWAREVKMHVVIAIVGFRNPADIAGCLAALEPSSHQDFAVCICENGGADAYDAL